MITIIFLVCKVYQLINDQNKVSVDDFAFCYGEYG